MPDGCYHADPTALRLRLLSNGWAPIPVKSPDHPDPRDAGKAPLLPGWPKVGPHNLTADAVRLWASRLKEGNTGLVCGLLVVADLDAPVQEIADKLKQTAFAVLGPTRFIRIGRFPKVALCYRVAEPMTKLTTKAYFLPDGTKLQVELLGEGQQSVGFGIHPDTGKPYTWVDASPLDHPFDDVPLTTRSALQTFRQAAEAILQGSGAVPAAAPKKAKGTNARSSKPKAISLAQFYPPPTLSEVKDALRAVPNTHDWEGWVKIGAAIYDALADDGEDLFLDWSAQSTKNDPSATKAKWKSYKTSPMDTKAATLFWEARQSGWRPASEGRDEVANPEQGTAIADGAVRTAINAEEKVDVIEHDVAAAFAKRHEPDLRFCHTAGTWYLWNGSHWAKNETRLAFTWARATAVELAAGQDLKTRIAAGKAAFAGAVERFAQADPALAVTASAWDRDPWLLGTPSGTVDLRTGLLRPAAMGDLICRATSVPPADAAACPVFLNFMKEATGDDNDLLCFLQRWFGYCLTGITTEHALLFVYGPGGNGKGVLLQTVGGILGTYAATAAMDTFTAAQGERHPTDLAMLHGARLVMTTETEEGRAWAEARIKALTGGDPITARFMRRDFFTYQPTFKLTISGNHRPTLRNVDDAARRRFNIVPFRYKPLAPDPRLPERLQAEWPGILRWMIDGCLAWQRDGLLRPTVVVEATAEYFEEQDILAQWIDDCCEVGDGFGTTSTALFHSWRDFCTGRSEDPGSAKWLATALERRGFRKAKDCELFRGRGFRGVRVRTVGVRHWQDKE